MHFLAWTWLAIGVLYIFFAPLSIGKPREAYSYGEYVLRLIGLAGDVLLCGRVLGWW